MSSVFNIEEQTNQIRNFDCSDRLLLITGFLFILFFGLDDGGETILRNASELY
jgi:hypothetical protein